MNNFFYKYDIGSVYANPLEAVINFIGDLQCIMSVTNFIGDLEYIMSIFFFLYNLFYTKIYQNSVMIYLIKEHKSLLILLS